jgi:hypothetical protein
VLFASPLWFFALLPWSAVVLWILWGRRKRTYVPFLDLWRGPALQKPAQRALQPPPIFLAAALFATLLAIFAAAEPAIRSALASSGRPITIVVDRGITMSALGRGQPRFVVAARDAVKKLDALFRQPRTTVELWTVPGNGPRFLELGNVDSAIADLPLTAIDTQADVEETIRGRLGSSQGNIILVSDRRLAFDDPRLIQISPQTPIDDVGIVTVVARETPRPQIMVRLRNDSPRKSVPMTISTGSQIIQQTADLPDRGQSRDYFIDPARMDAVIEVAIDARDDQPADDRAWLVREGSYPKIEPRVPLSPELRRMIDVYGRTRPPSQSSPTVAIVGAEADLPSQTPAVIVAPSNGQTVHGAAAASADPIAANVGWPAFPAQIQIAGAAPKGWTPVVSMGDHVIVAARREPIRRVWVGFEISAAWSATPDFVVFWANVFTWAGEGRERFAAYAVTGADSDWKRTTGAPLPTRAAPEMWPGLYQRSDGALRAFNATLGDERATATSTKADWGKRLLGVVPAGRNGRDLTSGTLLLAMCCVAIAALTWKRRRNPA